MVKLIRNGVETYDYQLHKGDLIEARVEKLVFGGQGIIRLEDESNLTGAERKRALVVFVEGVAPGDLVEIEILSLRHNLARGKVIRFLQPAPERIQPKCKHFGLAVADNKVINDNSKNCGGCSWQFLTYDDQLKVKWQEVHDSLSRIGGIDKMALASLLKPVIGMENPWYYRNKMEFSFTRADSGNGPWQIGLHLKGRFHDVCEIEECHLFRPWIGRFLNEVRKWLLGENIEGNLQSLYVRRATNTGEVLVNLVLENGQLGFKDSWQKFMEKFFAENTDILEGDKLVSLFLTQITNIKGQRKKTDEHLLIGRNYFVEELRLEGNQVLKFQVSPQAFLQPNTLQAEKIYNIIGQMAFGNDSESNEITVYDLFCGTGTIGLSLASRVKKVIGVELNASALEMAKMNAEINLAKNCEWQVADVAKVLGDLLSEKALIIVDPPRAGLGTKIVEDLVNSKTQKLIYVSCNPSTLARDLRGLIAGGYQLKRIEIVDQFCHTYHIETVCLLERP